MRDADARSKFAYDLPPMPIWPVSPSLQKTIDDLLMHVCPERRGSGMLETSRRVAKMWQELTSGYHVDTSALLKTFEDGANGVDEMVVVRDIPFYSVCSHHLAPFFGTATVAYIPNGRVIGLSKINRLVDAFARRLQIQERLTNQIADTMSGGALLPLGVGVVLNARHLCMESRGIRQQGCSTTTSALRGVIKDKPEARAEFLALTRP